MYHVEELSTQKATCCCEKFKTRSVRFEGVSRLCCVYDTAMVGEPHHADIAGPGISAASKSEAEKLKRQRIKQLIDGAVLRFEAAADFRSGVLSRFPLSSMYRLERSETYEVTTPFVEDYRTTGDAATFAQAYTNFFRAFTEPVLRIAFSSCADIDALVSDVFSGAERLIRENPDAYMYQYVCVAALMTRL